MKSLFIFEFGESQGELHTSSLIKNLKILKPNLQVNNFHGIFKTYKPGGMSFFRILNLLYMYFMLPIKMVLFRPEFILVRSSPPCIQLWAGLLGWITKIPTICWLMDYHPEIEIRYFAEINRFRWIAKLLGKIDTFVLNRLTAIIVLDYAMEQLCKNRAPELPYIVHPTWSKGGVIHYKPVSYKKTKNQIIHLAHVGNLGIAHGMNTLEKFLNTLSNYVKVEILVVNCSSSGKERFKRLQENTSISLEFLPRQSFDELYELFETKQIDFGLVLMKEFYMGLISPSKFAGYIQFGIPLLYIGPPNTNSFLVCKKFNAGINISNKADEIEIKKVCNIILDKYYCKKLHLNTSLACSFFAGKNAKTLSEKLLPYLLKKKEV